MRPSYQDTTADHQDEVKITIPGSGNASRSLLQLASAAGKALEEQDYWKRIKGFEIQENDGEFEAFSEAKAAGDDSPDGKVSRGAQAGWAPPLRRGGLTKQVRASGAGDVTAQLIVYYDDAPDIYPN
jgi:hypothetical protein